MYSHAMSVNAPAPPFQSTEPYVVSANTGGVVRLTLNRPARFNALSLEMIAAIEKELEAIGRDSSARVVVRRIERVAVALGRLRAARRGRQAENEPERGECRCHVIR